MKRAAAKIVVNISFEASFLSGLGGETPGPAMFKFMNFTSTAPVLSTGYPITPEPCSFDGFKYANFNNPSASGKKYGIITYSYPCTWTETIDAPCIIVKIPFSDGVNTVDHYYNIPILSSGTSLERNHIYTVNVEIDSKGSY
jgi:hypothetical protein